MAINTNYIRPHSEVYQLLNVAVSQAGDHGMACILGSQYDLYRYNSETLPGYPYGAGSSSIKLEYDKDDSGLIEYEVDQDSIQLYGEGLLAEITAIDGTISPIKDSYTVLQAPSDKYWAADYSQDVDLVCENYSISLGDAIFVNGSYATVTQLIASSTNPAVFDRIKVSTNLFDLSQTATTLSGVKVCKVYSGVFNAPFDYDNGVVKVTSDEQTIKIKGKNGADVTGTFIKGYGLVYVEFRVKVNYIAGSEDGLITVSSIADIEKEFGSIDINNELAYACYCAIRGSQGRAVYAVRVAADTPEAYLDAMKKTDSNDQVYAFVPITANINCMDVVATYNETLSSPSVKKWRINLFGSDVQNAAATTKDARGVNLSGTMYKKGDAYLFEASDKNVKNGFTFENFSAGDTITITTDDSTYTIKAVLADNLVSLFTGMDATQTDVTIEVTRSNTVHGNISYTKELASRFNSRRSVVVWCDSGKLGDTKVSNAYIAAEIAGLTSAVLPHQGLTNTEITSIDNARKMYTSYTQAQLDDVAAHGVLIVTQDVGNTSPYIRHQLTTSPDKGILYSELSCTRNIDNLSYQVADTVRYYVGRANVVEEAINAISSALTDIWFNAMRTSYNALLGPQLVAYDNYTIQQDPLAQDRLIINVDYYIPSPLNVIQVYQMVYVATVTL